MKKVSILSLLTLMTLNSIQVCADIKDSLYCYYFRMPSTTKEKFLQGALGVSTGFAALVIGCCLSCLSAFSRRSSRISGKSIILTSLGASSVCGGAFGGAVWATTVGGFVGIRTLCSKIQKWIDHRNEVKRKQGDIDRFVKASDRLALCNMMYEAICENDVWCVKKLISAGVDINVYKKNCFTYLARAVQSGNVDIIKILLDAGADVNIHDFEFVTKMIGVGWPPLMCAVSSEGCKKNEIIQLLLAAGADVSLKDEYGWTALNLAIFCKCSSDIIKALLLAGADVNVSDSQGWTPLMNACFNRNEEIVKILLNAGADKSLCNIYGDTALDIAQHHQHTEIIALLQK